VIVLLFFSFLQSFYYTPWNAIISKTITVLNIILIVTAFMIYLKGQLHVKYYVFALMLFFIFIVLFVSMLSGTVNYNFITRYGYLFALCIEVVVFSLMLADRHNRTKNKQLQTQKELLALQNNQKKALEQEVENKTKRLCVLLSERELLLKEVFHRVKNNFHMITAFLWLESKKQGDAHCFDELINRIQSMSLIHEYLCHNESLTQIDSNKYLQELVTILTKSYKNIDISFDIDSFIINFDDIISLSVILNELISNSVKHNSHVALHLHIQCKLKEKHIIEFCLQDNGKGFENTKVKKGFGLRLIDDFVQKLPQAKATFHTQEGTLFVLEFQQRKTDEVV
jgi:two-component sensor histidine kinase